MTGQPTAGDRTDVVTVTPSPAIDWTITVGEFALGGVNIIEESRKEASGKGVNVAWALHRAGVRTEAVAPVGGLAIPYFKQEFDRGELPYRLVEIEGETRTNVSLITPGQSTKINQPGTHLSEAELTALADAVKDAASTARTIAFCGSLPQGSPNDLYAQLARSARASNPDIRVVVDSSNGSLSEALAAQPDLIKPNCQELAWLTGMDLRSVGDVEQAARRAIDMGAKNVLASLGVDGSMLITADSALVAVSHDIPFANAVGAGDGMLAGFLSTGTLDSDALFAAALWGSSAVACSTTLFNVNDTFTDRISVSELSDPERMLSDPAAA
ncbi:1-phosphofructokinase family hexose kinase [Corynebacterium mendelii]